MTPAGPAAVVVRGAGIASIAFTLAAGLHIAAFVTHRGDPKTALFFGTVAVLQLVAAIAVAGSFTRRTRTAVVMFSLGLLVLWVASRTTGVPGVHAGESHEVGALDALAAATALAGVVALVRPRFIRPQLVAGAAAVALVVGATGGLALPSAAHDHGGGADTAVHTSGDDHGVSGHAHP